MKMKKLVAGVLCLGLATFALTGCGGGSDDTAGIRIRINSRLNSRIQKNRMLLMLMQMQPQIRM